MIEVIQGERQPFTIKLRSKSTGEDWDLTGYSAITVCFKADTTTVEKTGVDVTVIGDDDKGKIQTALEVADTDSMPKTTNGQLEILVDYGSGDVRKAQILDAFHVVEKICST